MARVGNPSFPSKREIRLNSAVCTMKVGSLQVCLWEAETEKNPVAKRRETERGLPPRRRSPRRAPRRSGVRRRCRAVLPNQRTDPASHRQPDSECQPRGRESDPRKRAPNAEQIKVLGAEQVAGTRTPGKASGDIRATATGGSGGNTSRPHGTGPKQRASLPPCRGKPA